jgi:hypothetical protein
MCHPPAIRGDQPFTVPQRAHSRSNLCSTRIFSLERWQALLREGLDRRSPMRKVVGMWKYLLIELAVLVALVGFVTLMCQVVAKRLIWPGEPLQASFVGSLLSSSGTIFAASIAWAIADHSIYLHTHETFLQKAEATAEATNQWVQRFILETSRLEVIERQLINLLTNFPLDQSDHDAAAKLEPAVIPVIDKNGFAAPIPIVEEITDYFAQLASEQRRYSRAPKALIQIKPISEVPQIEAEIGKTITKLRGSADTLAGLIKSRRNIIPAGLPSQ